MASQSQDRPAHARNKSSSFSFLSQKSDKSSKAAKSKIDLTETDKERKKSKFNNKAISNPNRAMLEDQPAVRAQEVATLTPIRAAQHKDWQGNVISDPDFSNPARSRLERPLDTIRSFEAAIDGGHRRRAEMIRAESADLLTSSSSRRSSVVGSEFNVHPRSAAANSGPYMSQPSSRRQSQRDPYDHSVRGPPSSYPRRNMGPRMSSAPVFSPRQQYPQDYNGFNGYPQHGYHESYDTNAESSGTSEPWANSTDPSSENSSIDRIHASKQTDGGDAYAGFQHDHNPQRHGPIAEEGWHTGQGPPADYNQQSPPYQNLSRETAVAGNTAPHKRQGQRPPQPPSHDQPYPSQMSQERQQPPRRNVMPFSNQMSDPPITQPPPNAYNLASKPNALRKSNPVEKKEKRQSWLKRTFSRS